MAKYQITIDQDQCTSCACASGRCPTHARTLARLLNKGSSNGIIESDCIAEARKAAELCPEGAIHIERIS